MPLNFSDNSSKPFCMYDNIEYPAHMDTAEKRLARYEQASEALDTVSGLCELEAFEEEYMEDMKSMGNFKYKRFEKDVAEKKLAFLDSIPY
jgi:antirestriction protein